MRRTFLPLSLFVVVALAVWTLVGRAADKSQNWAAYGGDKSQISAACKTSNDAFAAQAAAMKC